MLIQHGLHTVGKLFERNYDVESSMLLLTKFLSKFALIDLKNRGSMSILLSASRVVKKY